MAKKNTKNKTRRVKSKPKKSSSDIRHIETLIFYTERNINSNGDGLGEVFREQSERLHKRLKDLKDGLP